MLATDVAKKIYECFAKGDLSGVLACLSESIEWKLIGPSSIPYFGTYKGISGVEKFFASLFEHEEILEFVPEEFIGSEKSVAVTGRERCRAKSTSIEFTVQWTQIFDVTNGKVVRWREYIDTAPMVAAYTAEQKGERD
jgi:ketosteroid isomerase-like protein